MKKALTVLAIGAILVSIAFVSCQKNDNSAPPKTDTQVANFYTNNLSGLGTHFGWPSGNAFHLPSNIKIIGCMVAGDPGNKSSYKPPSKNLANLPIMLPKGVYTPYGLGTYVNIYAKLVNTSSHSYNLIIPSGLIMCDSIPGDTTVVDTTQGGIIIPPDTIPCPGGDTVRVCLKSFLPQSESSCTYFK